MAFNCTICNRTFTTQTALQNHIYAHHEDSKNKEFSVRIVFQTILAQKFQWCDHEGYAQRQTLVFCSARETFPKKEDLDTHVKVIHMGVKEFTCQICNSSFGYKRKLGHSHEKNVHPKNC